MRASLVHLATLPFVCIALVSGCGGGSGSSASAGSTGGATTVPASASYVLGGTVRGLADGTSVVLSAASGEHVTVTANQDFVLSKTVQAGSSYQVLVQTDPAGQKCVAYRAGGTVAGNVNDVDIVCNPVSVTVEQHGAQVTRIAGRAGVPGTLDGPASQASIFCPFGIAIDRTDALYVSDSRSQTVRRIGTDGMVSTVAGLPLLQQDFPTTQYARDGDASVATFDSPGALVFDASGNLYVSESIEHAIRRITPAGVVSTYLGAFHSGFPRDGTLADAEVDQVTGAVADAAGNLYFADFNGDNIRKLTPQGVMTTIAGATYSNGTADGLASAARFDGPFGIAVTPDGTLYVSDRNNQTIRRISNGTVTTVTTVAGVAGVAGNADGAGAAARFYRPSGLTLDPAGNLYIVDSGNRTVRMMSPAGVVTTVAGDASATDTTDGYGTAAHFVDPYQIAIDSHGDLYVADCGDRTVRRIVPGNATAQVVSNAVPSAYPATGVVTTLAGVSGQSGYVDAKGADARIGQSIATGTGIAVDTRGYLYVADPRPNNVVRMVSPDGVVSTLAGTRGSQTAADGTGLQASFSSLTSLAMGPGGVLYAADGPKIRKITAAGAVTSITPAPNFDDNPAFLAVTPAGTIMATDNLSNHVVQITAQGTMSVVAGFTTLDRFLYSYDAIGAVARFYNLGGIALDSTGNAYVADVNNYTVRKVTPAGVVTTFAGQPGVRGNVDGPAATARFMSPVWIAVDAADNVYVAESHNVIRKISAGGIVTTVAGLSGTAGSADGAGASARFSGINAMTVDAGGTIYVVDNGAVRKIVQK